MTYIYARINNQLKRWEYQGIIQHKDAVASLNAIGVQTKPVMLVYA